VPPQDTPLPWSAGGGRWRVPSGALFCLALVLVLLLCAAIGYAALLATAAGLQEENEKKAAALAYVLVAPLERATRLRIELHDLRGVVEFIADVAADHPDVAYVAVTQTDGGLVHHFGRQPPVELLAAAAAAIAPDGGPVRLDLDGLVQVTVPVKAHGMLRAAVHVAVEPRVVTARLLARLSGLVAAALLALALLVELLAAAERRWLAMRLDRSLAVLRATEGEQAGPAPDAMGDEVGDLAGRAEATSRRIAAERYLFASWVQEVRASQIDPLAQARIDTVRDQLVAAPVLASLPRPDAVGSSPRLAIFLVLTAEVSTWPLWMAHDVAAGMAPVLGGLARSLPAAGGLFVAAAGLGLLAAGGWRCGPRLIAAILLAAALGTVLAGDIDAIGPLLLVRGAGGLALAVVLASAVGGLPGGAGRGGPATAVLASACIAGPALATLLPRLGLVEHGFALAGLLLVAAAVAAWFGDGLPAGAAGVGEGWRAIVGAVPGSLALGLLAPALLVNGSAPPADALAAMAAAASPSVAGLVALVLLSLLAWRWPATPLGWPAPLLLGGLAAVGLAGTAWLQPSVSPLLGAACLGAALAATWLLPLVPQTADGPRPAIAAGLAVFALGFFAAAPLADLGAAIAGWCAAALVALGVLLAGARRAGHPV